MLSMSSCRTTRRRVAPSAMRMATSRERFTDRESSRLATLAHAISSTKLTDTISARNMGRAGPPTNRSGNPSCRPDTR
jgi:hypothetical protein